MYSEAEKLHLIEEVIKIKSESVLREIETLIKKSQSYKKIKKASASDFLGILSAKDALLMDAAIEEGCEQINTYDWK